MLAVPLAGGLSGAVGWFVSYPLDCVKAQVQGARSGGGSGGGSGVAMPPTQRGVALAAAARIWRERGLRGLCVVREGGPCRTCGYK